MLDSTYYLGTAIRIPNYVLVLNVDTRFQFLKYADDVHSCRSPLRWSAAHAVVFVFSSFKSDNTHRVQVFFITSTDNLIFDEVRGFRKWYFSVQRTVNTVWRDLKIMLDSKLLLLEPKQNSRHRHTTYTRSDISLLSWPRKITPMSNIIFSC